MSRQTTRQTKRGTKLEKPKAQNVAKRRAGIIAPTQPELSEEDMSKLDAIDLIIMSREKKISIEVPPPKLTESQVRTRKCYLAEGDMFHLMHEIKGTRYGLACRPELYLLTVFDQSSEVPVEIEVIFDEVKCLFVLSPRIEDYLIQAAINDPVHILEIKHAITRCGDNSTDFVTISMQKTWRRFVSLHILPLTKDVSRVNLMKSRVQAFIDRVRMEQESTSSAVPMTEGERIRVRALEAALALRAAEEEKFKQQDGILEEETGIEVDDDD